MAYGIKEYGKDVFIPSSNIRNAILTFCATFGVKFVWLVGVGIKKLVNYLRNSDNPGGITEYLKDRLSGEPQLVIPKTKSRGGPITTHIVKNGEGAYYMWREKFNPYEKMFIVSHLISKIPNYTINFPTIEEDYDYFLKRFLRAENQIGPLLFAYLGPDADKWLPLQIVPMDDPRPSIFRLN